MKMFSDSVGNILNPGDIVRMFHFTGARNRKHYMYKRFLRYERYNGKTFGIWENLTRPGTFNDCENSFKESIVIVQRAEFDPEEKELRKNPKMRD